MKHVSNWQENWAGWAVAEVWREEEELKAHLTIWNQIQKEFISLKDTWKQWNIERWLYMYGFLPFSSVPNSSEFSLLNTSNVL